MSAMAQDASTHQGGPAPDAAGMAAVQPDAQAVGFKPLEPGAKPKTAVDLEFLLDIPLQVTVEIGRTKMLINDLLQLGQGSIIELDKPDTDSSFDVLVNDKVIARGEIVVVNDRFGVRLTDVISPMERVQQIA
jgi:flagellar motor switch protein FliN/FliY